ncbi:MULTISPECIES: I78 family peptidase inhibitor [Kitasatospora]|uniref:I78 family peptidase inhibitor n=1 Tax=Kitasatospora cinereorecta TaxID=285560 RepID=A0ABW0VDS2_9ACTN|nr:I78 family peptidase inhibitor [Kitasatospora paracochleata]
MDDEVADYRGLPVEVARTLAADRGWRTVRELEPGALLTMEYRSDRLNLTVRDGVVERAWTG